MKNFTKLIYSLGMLCLLTSTAYSQASLVKDIRPGSISSSPRYLVEVNGTLFFSAYNDTNGYELWKSDGTATGTELVKDILAGSGSSYPQYLAGMNGTLFFMANNGTNGYELWKSDGTAEGTVLVKDIAAGSGSGGPHFLTEVNGTLFFSANANNGITGTELWKSDGTAEGTVLVKDIAAGSGGSYPQYLASMNGTLFFDPYDSTHGRELWKSDGTEAGTVLVKDILPGSGGSGPRRFTEVNGTLFFEANDGSNGYELWKSDGTAEGTVLVKDIVAGNGHSLPSYLTEVNGTLFFRANNGTTGTELWKSDGTEEGTIPVDVVNNKVEGTSIIHLFTIGNILYFSATSGSEGQELWRTDGTEEGTYLAADINPGAGSSNPSNFSSIGHTLYFQTDDGVHGTELWKYEPDCTEPKPYFSSYLTCAGKQALFHEYSVVDVDTNVTYLWDFGDGATDKSKGIVRHTYTDPGEYKVTLTITQEECSASNSHSIVVNSLPEVTLAPFDDVIETDEPFTLYGGSPTGGKYSGPGVSRGRFDPSDVGPGKYKIKYTYIDFNTGCQDTTSQYITVLPTTQEVAIESFTLVNADTDTDIMELTDGMQLYLHALPNAPLSIRANTDPATVGSVSLALNSPLQTARTEGVAPYALFGDENGDYKGENFGLGSYTISATPYTSSNLKGAKGQSLSIDFDIVEDVLDCAGFSASVTQITDVSTCGGSDGSATVGATGGSGTLTYQWSHGTATATASNLAPGNYSVTVADAQGCSETLNVYVGEPALPEVALSSFAPVSETDAPFALSGGSPAGGSYSGEGVSNGQFDPSAVGSGSYEITYAYTDPTTQCTDSAAQMITVEPELQGDAVVSFTLVNADTDADIMELTDGMQLNIHELPNAPLAIRANTNPSTVGSVFLSLSGVVNASRKEGVAPYALFGDIEGDYEGQLLGTGQYTLLATPYSEANLKGEAGQGLSIDFEIVEETPDCAGFSDVTLAPFSSVMEDDPAFALSGGSPAGGTYSGPGVSNGMFDPSAVDPGTYEITYTYTDADTQCSGSASQWMTVEPLVLGIPVHIARFVLVNAETDTDIMELTDGMQVNIHDLSGAALNIRAETYPDAVSSVKISLSGAWYAIRKEGVAPYALFGDMNGDYEGENLVTGTYYLSATPYTLDEVEEETEGEALSITFTIVDQQPLNLRTLNAEIDALVNEVEGKIAQQNQDKMAVYPNPFSDNIHVEITDAAKEVVEVYLIDMYGKTLWYETITPTSGKSKIHLDAENLPNGTYILKVKWGDHVRMEKLIKQ